MPAEAATATAETTSNLKQPPADPGKAASGKADADAGGSKEADKTPPASLAAGADKDEDVIQSQANWPEDWRERLAGKDEASLKALKRYQSPEGIWGKVRNLEKAVSNATPKKPDEDATPEEVAAWRTKVGLAESPEKLLASVKLPDGRTIGDDDKPLAASFAKAVWGDSTPEQFSRALSWYYDHQEEAVAQRIEQDEAYQVESRKALKEEWGPGEFKRNVNHLGTLFTDAPDGLFDYMMTARGNDGRLLGDNPNLIKFLVGKAFEISPQATITAGGQGGTSSVDDRLKEIRSWRDSPDYKLNQQYWDPKVQKEERDLIELQLKQKNRRQAA